MVYQINKSISQQLSKNSDINIYHLLIIIKIMQLSTLFEDETQSAYYDLSELLQLFQSSEQCKRIHAVVRKTCQIVHTPKNGAQLLVQFPPVTKKFEDSQPKLRYKCKTCLVRLNCERCFKEKQHTGHIYLKEELNQGQKYCDCDYLNTPQNKFSKGQQMNPQKQETLDQQEEAEFVSFYFDCFSFYILLKEHHVDSSANIYIRKLCQHLFQNLQQSRYYRSLLQKIFSTSCQKSSTVLEVILLKYGQNLSTQFIKLCSELKYSPNFRCFLIKAIINQPLNKKSKIKQLLPRDLDYQISALFLLTSSEQLHIPQQNKQFFFDLVFMERQWILPIKFWENIFKLGLFPKKKGRYSLNSSQTRQIMRDLAPYQSQHLFPYLFHETIIFFLSKKSLQNNQKLKKSSFSFVSNINQLFKLLVRSLGGEQRKIIPFFEKNKFTTKEINQIIFQYIEQVVEKDKFSEINLLVLRVFVILAKEHQITLIFPTLWEKLQISGKKLNKLIKSIIKKQLSISSTTYNIKVGKQIKNPEFVRKFQKTQNNWLKQFIRFKKSISQKQLLKMKQSGYFEFIDSTKILQSCTRYSQQTESYHYVFKDKNPSYMGYLTYIFESSIETPITLQQFQILEEPKAPGIMYSRKQYLPILLNGICQKIIENNNVLKEQMYYLQEQNLFNFYEQTKYIFVMDSLTSGGIISLREFHAQLVQIALTIPQNLGNIDLLLGTKNSKKEQNIKRLFISENLMKKQDQIIAQNSVNKPAITEKFLKMKKLKQKFNKKANQIRTTLKNIGLESTNNNIDQEITCIVCRECADHDNPLYYLSRIEECNIVERLYKNNARNKSIDSCFHLIHFGCFAGYIQKKKEKCPLCTLPASFMLPVLKDEQFEELFFETPAFAKFFEDQSINKAEDIFQILYLTLIFQNGISLFQDQKNINGSFNNTYFLILIRQLFQNEQDFLKVLEDSEKKLLGMFSNCTNKIVAKMQEILIKFFGGFLRNYGEITKQLGTDLMNSILDLWKNYCQYFQTKLFIKNIQKLIPTIVNDKIENFQSLEANKFLLFDCNIPLNIKQAYSCQKELQKSVLIDKQPPNQQHEYNLCLLCNKYFYCSGSRHNNEHHENSGLFLQLLQGNIHRQSKIITQSDKVYENKWGQVFQMQGKSQSLEGFSLNMKKLRKIISEEMFKTKKKQSQPVSNDNDW